MSDTWDTVGNTASDLASSAITDVGDTYQEILLQDAGISAPDGVGAQTWETVTTAEPDAPMSDSQLADLIAEQPEQEAPEPTAPAPEMDIE